MADTPLNTPWSVSPSPELLDDLIVEIVDTENAPGSYIRLAPGTPHPNQELYGGYIFLKQTTLSHSRVQRFWSTPAFQNQNVLNYERDFVAESASHPVFIRTYKTRRDQYTPLAAISTLTGVWLIKLTNAGTGYNPDLPPTVTIGGPGSGATAVALVNPDGTLQWIRITAEGTGYTSATVTITPPASGTTATATASVQSTDCVLVSQKTQNFPEDDPRYSLFLIEIRAYKTLPGPILSSRGFRPDGTMILRTERDVLVTTLPEQGPGILSSTMQAVNSIEGKLVIERLVVADGVTPITNDEGYILFHTEPRTNAMLGTILRVRPTDEPLPAVGGAAPLGSGFIIEVHQIELKNSTNVIQAITVKPLPTAIKQDFAVDRRGVRLVVLEYDDTAAAAEALAGSSYPTGVIEIDVSAIDTVQSRIRITSTADGAAYPGKTINKAWDDVARGYIWETEYYTPVAEEEPEVGSYVTIDDSDRVIIDAPRVRPSPDPEKNITTILTIATDRLLNPFVEFLERGEQEPGEFKFLLTSLTAPSTFRLNRPGFVFDYDVPESGRYLHKVVHTLINGGLDGDDLPEIWNGVTSPAAASGVFNIRANTVHPAFEVWDENGPLERFAASTPSYYRKGMILLVGAPCQLWRGTIFRLSLWYFSSTGYSSGNSNPAVYIQQVRLPKSPDGGFTDPSSATRLVYDGEVNDVMAVWGTENGSEATETIEIRHYGPVRGDIQFDQIFSIQLTSSGAVNPVIRATGTKMETRFTFTDNPSIGETWMWEIDGAQYDPFQYGYTFVNAEAWVIVTGGATLDGNSTDGIFRATGANVNGYPEYRSENELFTLISNGTTDYDMVLDSAPGNKFTGGTVSNPDSSGGAYVGSGTFTGTPTVTLTPAVPLTGANRIRIGETVEITKGYVVAALNGAPGEGTYNTVTPVPFFDGETAVESDVPGRIVLTDHVAKVHTVDYVGTAAGTALVTMEASNGAKIVEGAAGENQYRYNGQDLFNVNRRQIIAPNLTNAETRTVEYFSEKDITIKYVMSPEVSVEYQKNASGIWVALDTITGDDIASEEVDDVTEIKFRITNSTNTSRMLRLWTQWSGDTA